jgi:hypothetical protein
MMRFWLIILLLLPDAAMAKRVIDVGDLEVKGEVRRPFIQYIDTDKAAENMIPDLAKKELHDFEQELLKTEVKGNGGS